MSVARLYAAMAAGAALVAAPSLAQLAFGAGGFGATAASAVVVAVLLIAIQTRGFRGATRHRNTAWTSVSLLIIAALVAPSASAMPLEVAPQVASVAQPSDFVMYAWCNPLKGSCWGENFGSDGVGGTAAGAWDATADWAGDTFTKENFVRYGPAVATAALGCVAGIAVTAVSAGIAAPVGVGACAAGVGTVVAVNAGIDVATNAVTGDIGQSYVFQTATCLDKSAGRCVETLAGMVSPSAATCADKMSSGEGCAKMDAFGIAVDAIPGGVGALFKAPKAVKPLVGLAAHTDDLAKVVPKFGSNVIDVPFKVSGKAGAGATKLAPKAPTFVGKASEKVGSFFTKTVPKAADNTIGYTARGFEKAAAKSSNIAKGIKPLSKGSRGLLKTPVLGGAKVFFIGMKHPKAFVKTLNSTVLNFRDNKDGIIGGGNLPRDCAVDDFECLLNVIEDYCNGSLDIPEWDSQLMCSKEVLDYIECLAFSDYEDPKLDPACQELIVPEDVICDGSNWDLCEEGPLQPESDLDLCIKALAEFSDRDSFCAHLVAGGDPAEQFLDLVFESSYPVISMTGKNEDAAYVVTLKVDHGAFGIKCSEGDAARFARLLGYCMESYIIAGLAGTQMVEGEVADVVSANRQALAASGALNNKENLIAHFPFENDYDGDVDINMEVRVFYQFAKYDFDGNVIGVEPLPKDGVPDFYFKDASKSFTIEGDCESNCEPTPPECTSNCGPPPCTSNCDPTDGDDPVDPGEDVDCNDIESCAEDVDGALGGLGLGYIVKYWYVVLAGLAFIVVWRNGKLYTWTSWKGNPGIGRKPNSVVSNLHKKPGVFGWIQKQVTGKAPKPKLRDEYRVGGVPVVLPPNEDGTGPDYSALDRLRRKGGEL